MYQRILLPLDGSALAEQALPHAVAQAERLQAELILLRVLVPLVPEGPGIAREAVRRAQETTRALARQYLEHVAASVQEHGVPVQVVTVEGRPHMELVRFAETNQVDLIVICSRGRSGASRWLMGSVADRVAQATSVPVLLVPASMNET